MSAKKKMHNRMPIAFSLLTRRHYIFLFMCFLAICGALLIQLMLPLGLSLIMDALHHPDGIKRINRIFLIMILLFIVRSILSFSTQYHLQSVGDDFIFRLRQNIYQKLLSLEIPFHEDRMVGDIESRINNDIGFVRLLVTTTPMSLATNTLQLVATTAILLTMDLRLGCMALATGISTWTLSGIFAPVFRRLSINIQEKLAAASGVMQEAMTGIETVISFARERHELLRYRLALVEHLASVKKIRLLDSFHNSTLMFTASTSAVIIFRLGGGEVLNGTMSASLLVAAIFYTQHINQSISGIGKNIASINQAVGASQRVFDILNTTVKPINATRWPSYKAKHINVEFRNVCFEYKENIATIRNASFEVRSGETVVLTGPSGSGKSTLCKLMLRLHEVSSGNILFNGQDIQKFSIQSIRDSIAVVSQDVFLSSSSIRENIRYGNLDASDEEIEIAGRAANAHNFVMRLERGYDTRIGARGIKLSGGQRQRISIARAILRNAPILILDEATSALDRASEHLVLDALARLKEHRTTLVISHRHSSIRQADRVVIINNGMICGQGHYDDLVKQGGPCTMLLAGKSNRLLRPDAPPVDIGTQSEG
ncbi:ABC transporter ATP-binding protein [Frateuria aurantia]